MPTATSPGITGAAALAALAASEASSPSKSKPIAFERTAEDLAPELVFNKGPGTFVHEGLVLKPNGRISVPRWVASMWKKLSLGFVSSTVDQEAEIASKSAAADAAIQRSLTLESQVADLSRELAEMKRILDIKTRN